MPDWLRDLPWEGLSALFSAAAGGLVSFLFALKKGRIRDNRFWRKAAIEIVGGALTGFFISLTTPGRGGEVRCAVAFFGGLFWSGILEQFRDRITSAMLGAVEGFLRPSGKESSSEKGDDQ